MFKTLIRSISLFLVLAAFPIQNASTQEAKEAPLDAAQKEAIVQEISGLLNQYYVFADTAKKMEERIRTRLKNGDYDKLSGPREFAQAVSDDLTSVSKDRHLHFVYAPEMAAEITKESSKNEDEARQAREKELAEAKRDNFGFRKVERLAGNIGYLDFRYFASAGQAGETAVAALKFLSNSDALIIDLRQNGGGDPTQIQLITSYFFAEPTHLNDIYTRSEDKTENYWTLPYVPGTKMVDADLYVLTSSDTFSGAEEFCYNLKNLKRATLIGETTGGGAHPTDGKVVHANFVLRVPNARAINPITKTNWEGTGVAPDIQVPAAEAFDRAYSMALEKLSAKTSDPSRKSEIDWVLTGQKAKLNPIQVPEKTLKMYAGAYGARKVILENGGLLYQRTGPKYRMIPMTETLFGLEGLDYFRIEFVVKDGKVPELIGHYDNGQNEPSARTK